MEAKIWARRPVRTAITKCANQIKEEVNKPELAILELKALTLKMNDLGEKVGVLDEDILGLLLEANVYNEENYEKECKGIEEYQDTVRYAKLLVEDKLSSIREPTVAGSNPATSWHGDNPINAQVRLPKIELRKFGGDLCEWLSWWAQFEKIHNCEMDAVDKYHYLKQSMKPGTRAFRLVDSYPETRENYPKVIQALEDRFGDKSLLAESYVRKLQKVVLEMSSLKNASDLETVYDDIETQLRSLDSLDIVLDKSTFLVPLIEAGLPVELLRVWQRCPESGCDEDIPSSAEERLPALLKFLRREIKGEERIQLIQSRTGEVKNSSARNPKKGESFEIGPKGCGLRDNKSPPTALGLTTLASEPCLFCLKDSHSSQDCDKAVNMSFTERNGKVAVAKVCYKCLKKGHFYGKCSVKVRCVICGKSHYPVLCRGRKAEWARKEKAPPNSEQVMANSCSSSEGLIVLKTLLVNIKSKGKNSIRARLLFDEGSTYSYIRSSLAEESGSPVVEQLCVSTITFGGIVNPPEQKTKYQVQVENEISGHRETLNLIGQSKICGPCPKIPRGPWLDELNSRGIRINDLVDDELTEVEILVGSDLWGRLMTGRMFKLACGLVAVESVLGWTLSGRVPAKATGVVNNIIALAVNAERISDLWSLELLGIGDPVEKVSREEHDLRVKEEFQKEIGRDADGRYVVKLPWVERQIKGNIPCNKEVALRRLTSTVEKLHKQHRLGDYDKIFKEWLDEKIIELDQEKGCWEHFLPHRPVFKPSSLTTPVRPVFDASSHGKNQLSLNHFLEKGPNLLELIPDILLRFRLQRYGVVADIRKAFQMIGVAEEDRDFQKFWWRSETQPVVFRHCRVVFGMNCSPFILAAVLDYHLSRVSAAMKPTAERLREALYVDNCVLSVNSQEEYTEFKVAAIKLKAEAKMDLRQWESSLDECPENPETMVLGLVWDKIEDVLFCQTPHVSTDFVVTKRSVLSVAARIFDPLGVISPAVLQLKLMLQDAWIRNVGWDEEWDEVHRLPFLKWANELSELRKLRVPRCVSRSVNFKNYQIHLFTDASQSSYAAVVYLRVQEEIEVQVPLLMAKARLAPLSKARKITIPRLELLACVIGARLVSEVVKSLSLSDVPLFCWSDSSTALAWIRRDDQWGSFVSNRTKEINRILPRHAWRHVPGGINPADLPSRGCSLSELVRSKWWKGPEWLKTWNGGPQFEDEVDEEEVVKERRKTAVVNTNVVIENLRFSDYWKNVKVYAWVMRFISNVRVKEEEREKSKILTVKEMESGEYHLLRNLQRKYYPGASHSQLSIMKGDDQLLRVKTRLEYRDDTVRFKYPILLPGSDPLIKQLIEFVHKFFCHAGTQFVLGKLRERYWITQGRRSVGNVIKRCLVCRRFTAKKYSTVEAPLPLERIETSWAFKTTGVDLAGPVFLKGAKKVWIVIFTCAVYRGVYLDIVDSLSAEEFVLSLERFTCTVGRPSVLFSDNGTNFVGSQSLMRSLNWDKLERQLEVSQIRWKFNPPTAAWWGGWWERLIRTLKDLLRRMIGKAKLTRKELTQCLCEISFVINERPLTVLNEDPDDFSPLTPAMFMRDLPIGGLPEFNLIVGRDLQSAYRKLLVIKETLKARFRKEYLANLVMRPGKQSRQVPKVGDVVLVGSDNKKRFEWPLGRIIKLLPGKDGKIRLCEVKTKHGTLLRPIQRLYPLELCSQEIPASFEESRSTETEDTTRNVPDSPMLFTKRGRRVKTPNYSTWK